MAEIFEDEYLDVLQNIEAAIVQVYKEHPEMTDWDALNAIQALGRVYQAEVRKRNLPAQPMAPLVQLTFDAVKAMCDWRLGRSGAFQVGSQLIPASDAKPKTVDEIVACLKRIRRSIEMWNKEGGRRGYLNFISQFVR